MSKHSAFHQKCAQVFAKILMNYSINMSLCKLSKSTLKWNYFTR